MILIFQYSGKYLTFLLALAIILMVAYYFYPFHYSKKPDRLFEDVTDNAGLHYTGDIGEKLPDSATHLIDNEGVYVADVNNDFWPDILVTGSSEPALFLNRQGKFSRDDQFPAFDAKINAAAFTSLLNNTHPELILLGKEGSLFVLVYRNGSFRVENTMNIEGLKHVTGVAVGDVNQDKCPDIFVFQYGKREVAPHRRKQFNLGAKHRNLQKDNGLPNKLLIGNCSSLSFKPVNDTVFSRNHWSLAASLFDATGNNRQDIHVANDFFRDSLYLQKKNGEFQHHYLPLSTDRNGMSSQVLNLNNDTRPDLFVSNVHLSSDNKAIDRNRFMARYTSVPNGHNALINKGNGTFRDKAGKLNLEKPGWGWAVSWNDFNHDKNREILQVTENFLSLPASMKIFRSSNSNIAEFAKQYYPDQNISPRDQEREIYTSFRDWIGLPNLFRKNNDRYQLLSDDVSGLGRINGRGVASLDYDRDGDLDIVVSNFGGPFRLFENTTNSPEANFSNKNWLKVKIKDQYRGGILSVRYNGDTTIIPVTSRNDFMSQESSTYHFGLDGLNSVEELKMRWHTGEKQSRSNVKANQILQLAPNAVEQVGSR